MTMGIQHSTPAIIDVDMTVVGAVLERARAALSADDHACLQGLVHTFVELSKLVRERGTTLARLRRLFGLAASEKTADVFGAAEARDPDPNAHDTGVAAPDTNPNAHSGQDDPRADKKTRKGHGRLGTDEYPNARHIAVPHSQLAAGEACPDCAHGKLHPLAEPARLLRIVGQPALSAILWDCGRLRCGGCGTVFTASAPPVARGPKYDVTAVSMMALLRYGAGMPLHRLDRLQRNLGTPVPASTQWEVVRDHVSAMTPVHQALVRAAAQGRVLHNDDTSIRILSLMGKRRAALAAVGALADPDRTGLFTTGIMAITDVGPIALFFSGRKHAGENLAALLKERNRSLEPPIHMADGLDRNAPTDHPVVASNCLAHGRRHIVDEVENFPNECRHVLDALRVVFKMEKTCTENDLSPKQRLEWHQRESGPVMSELRTWLQARLDENRVEPNSGLGNAFRYLLKRWDKLTLFLRVPGAPIENNICERALKMAIRQRNNSLFYRSERGAQVGDIYMALIYTAELHGENPFEYLVALLEHECDVAAAPSDWLPWTFRATLSAMQKAAA
jgi:hypothetical protein